MKKIISFILATIMVLSLGVSSYASTYAYDIVESKEIHYTVPGSQYDFGYCKIRIVFDSNEDDRAQNCNFLSYPTNSNFRVTGTAVLSADGKTITVTSACVDTTGAFATIYRNFTITIGSNRKLSYSGVSSSDIK